MRQLTIPRQRSSVAFRMAAFRWVDSACMPAISRARVFAVALRGMCSRSLGDDVRTIRIGSGAGYSGDRIEPAVELAEKGDIQYLVFECLGERTVAWRSRRG